MITTITSAAISILLFGVAPTYVVIKGIDVMFKELTGKEKPIVVTTLPKKWRNKGDGE